MWLIARHGDGRPGPPREPLLVECDRGRRALAVFGHEEEAEMFLGFWAPGDGWRTREIGTFELASLLHYLWAGLGHVALDPLPAALAGAAGVDLPAGTDRHRFAERLARDLPTRSGRGDAT